MVLPMLPNSLKCAWNPGQSFKMLRMLHFELFNNRKCIQYNIFTTLNTIIIPTVDTVKLS